MDTSIVEIILQNLMELMPFRIIMSYQKGVRWTMGQNPKELAPGFHWCLPLRHSVEIVSCAEEFQNLPTQSVTTQDGKQICFSANIGYRITDAVAYFCEVQDFDKAVSALAMTHLAERVREKDYAWLVANQRDLERSLRGTLETRLKVWGAEVTKVGFTDYVQARQFRLFQDAMV